MRHRRAPSNDFEALEIQIALLSDMLDNLDKIVEVVTELLAQFSSPFPAAVTVTLDKGQKMPLSLPDTDRAAHTATASYTNADGSAYTGDTSGFVVTWASSDLNLETIDPTTGAWSCVGGDGTGTISVSVTLPDGNVLTGSDTVTTTAPVAPFPTGVSVTLA